MRIVSFFFVIHLRLGFDNVLVVFEPIQQCTISIHKENLIQNRIYHIVQSIYQVLIQSQYTKSICRIYEVHPKLITYTTNPPHLYSFFNVGMLCQIKSVDLEHGMNDLRCLHFLRSRHCPYYSLYWVDVYFMYSFLQNRYYWCLISHLND